MKWKKSSKNFKNVNFNFLGTTKLYNQMHSYTHFLPTVRGDPNAATTSDVLLTGNSIGFSLSNIIIREKTKGILFWRAEYYRRLFKKKSHFDINKIWVGTSTDSVVCILLHFFPVCLKTFKPLFTKYVDLHIYLFDKHSNLFYILCSTNKTWVISMIIYRFHFNNQLFFLFNSNTC